MSEYKTSRELLERLNTMSDEELDMPMGIVHYGESFGPSATTKITFISQGFDWNSGRMLIHTKDRLKPYEDK